MFWNGQNKSAIFIAKVMSWWWFWCQNVPDNGPSRCNRCSVRILYTLCAFRDSEWYCGTWWPPEAGGNGAVAAFRSKDNTGEGNQPQPEVLDLSEFFCVLFSLLTTRISIRSISGALQRMEYRVLHHPVYFLFRLHWKKDQGWMWWYSNSSIINKANNSDATTNNNS